MTLSDFTLLIKIILFLSIASISLADEKKIGSVTELNGSIVAITEELEERDSDEDVLEQNEFPYMTGRLKPIDWKTIV